MSKSKKNAKTASKSSKKISPKSKAEITLKFQSDSPQAKRKVKSRNGLLPHEQVTDLAAPAEATELPAIEQAFTPAPEAVDLAANDPALPAEAEPSLEATTAAPVAPCGDAEPALANDTTQPAGGDTGEPGATGGKRLGLVSAAIRVLEDAGEGAAMNCPELVKAATERGLWQPMAGKTPASTLYAAILREIRDKGDASRFTKADRGKFALNKIS